MNTLNVKGKTYQVDSLGFLIDYRDWDENFSEYMAPQLKIPDGLSKKHWEVIRFLRENSEKNRMIPTVYETCETNKLEIEEFADLFPDGYHRGAVKLAGLRLD